MAIREVLQQFTGYNFTGAVFLLVTSLLAWPLFNVYRALSSWVRRENFLRNSGIPKGPAFLEALTATTSIKPQKIMTDWMRRYGSIFWYHTGPFHVVLLTDPFLMAEVWRTQGAYDKPHFVYDSVTQVCSDKGHPNLASATQDDRWRLIRKATVPAFNSANLKRCYPAVNGVVARFLGGDAGTGPQSAFNVTKYLLNHAWISLGVYGFESDMGGIDNLKDGSSGVDKAQVSLEAFEEAGLRVTDPLRVWKLWDPELWKGNRVIREFQAIMKDLLRDLRAKQREGVLSPESLAASLLNTIDPETGKPLSDDLLLPEIGILFLAGFETVSQAMSWVIFAVSQNPEVEAKVTAELASLGLLATTDNPNPRALEWDDLPKLVYLDAVIKETMRRWATVAMGTVKEVHRDVLLGGKYTIPKGSIVWIPFYSVMRSEENWEDPDTFLPDRFLEPGCELAKAPHNADPKMLENDRPAKRFMPFSEGARNCVGMGLAKVVMPATLAALYSRFTFQLAPQMGGAEGVLEREVYHVTLGVEGGLHVIAQPRC
eukprot:jgi/Botrbrau1/13161/Bobra.0187s0109.1